MKEHAADAPGSLRSNRRRRFFGHGELRLAIMSLLTRGPSHGYELIKAIEEMTYGYYSPSAGVIYPTLEQLQARGLIAIAIEENGRKKIALTDEGHRVLSRQSEQLSRIEQKIKARGVGYALRKNPHMQRALENFKAVLDLKINQQPVSDAQLKKIIAIIDGAAMAISQSE